MDYKEKNKELLEKCDDEEKQRIIYAFLKDYIG